MQEEKGGRAERREGEGGRNGNGRREFQVCALDQMWKLVRGCSSLLWQLRPEATKLPVSYTNQEDFIKLPIYFCPRHIIINYSHILKLSHSNVCSDSTVVMIAMATLSLTYRYLSSL